MDQVGVYLKYAATNEEAVKALTTLDVGIVLLDCTQPKNKDKSVVDQLIKTSKNPEVFMILMDSDLDELVLFANTIKESICDVIKLPFENSRVNIKINNYRRMYFSVQRVSTIMESTFPPKIINIYRKYGRVTPKRYDNAVIIFTDFVNFSRFSSHLEPLELLEQLEKYFLKFDDICRRYHIEKIKTIGDAYMAIAGVMENTPEPEIRVCLAALEMQQYVQTEYNLLKAQGVEGWKIRIGINTGSLVGGIVGRDKIFYDVWGDSVNIAARAEQSSFPDQILITERVEEKVRQFLNADFYQEVEIKQRGGMIPMYFLKSIKEEYNHQHFGICPSKELMNHCQLFAFDFDRMYTDIVHFLKCYLSKELSYHTISRTLKIDKIVEKYARILSIDERSIMILRTAVLYHDIGYVLQYRDNEQYAILLAKNKLPSYGYTEEDIQEIQSLIWVTSFKATPKNILQELIRDANSDYLGRIDYFVIANNLRNELRQHGEVKTDLEWIDFQLNFLEHVHRYHTDLVKDLREKGKQKRIEELREMRAKLLKG